MLAKGERYGLTQELLNGAFEREREKPELGPLDNYALYRMRHQPDQLVGFVNQVVAASNCAEFAQTMAPIREASERYLSKFGVQVTDDPLDVARSVFTMSAEKADLPSPDSIEPVDLRRCWSAMGVNRGVLTVDYSLNNIWDQSGDMDAATVLQHFHMFTTGSRDTRHRVFSPIRPELEHDMLREYGGYVEADKIDPTEHLEAGHYFNLQHLLTSQPEVFWGFHGCAGNINAFDPLFRHWIQQAGRDRYRSPFICIAMEGLGANGSLADQHYRQIYGIEPDRTTLARYGQQQYEAIVASGIAGVPGIKKRYIGYSMGAAGLMGAKDQMITDEELIRESNAHKQGANGNTDEILRTSENARLKPDEPLQNFPGSSFFFFNPVYADVTVMAGNYPKDAPLRTKARAIGSRALVGIGKFTGKTGLDRIPGVPEAVQLGTRYLMGGGKGENIRVTTQHHGQNIRRDAQAVDLQEAELRAFKGLNLPQIRRINQNNAPSFTLIGMKDRITDPNLQLAAIRRELDSLLRHNYSYVEPVVMKVPTGHGLPYDDFMQTGYNLLGTLGDLTVEDRNAMQQNIGVIQEAINGSLPDQLRLELSVLARAAEMQANQRLTSVVEGSEQYQYLYTALINSHPKFMKSARFRAQYVNELISLLRVGADKLYQLAQRSNLQMTMEMLSNPGSLSQE